MTSRFRFDLRSRLGHGRALVSESSYYRTIAGEIGTEQTCIHLPELDAYLSVEWIQQAHDGCDQDVIIVDSQVARYLSCGGKDDDSDDHGNIEWREGWERTGLLVRFCRLHNSSTLPQLKSVELAPLAKRDWDIISANAGWIEENMLNQVCIVSVGRVFVLYVRGKALVRLRCLKCQAVDISSAIAGFLTMNSELHIAPYTQQSHEAIKSSINTAKSDKPWKLDVWMAPSYAVSDDGNLPGEIDDTLPAVYMNREFMDRYGFTDGQIVQLKSRSNFTSLEGIYQPLGSIFAPLRDAGGIHIRKDLDTRGPCLISSNSVSASLYGASSCDFVRIQCPGRMPVVGIKEILLNGIDFNPLPNSEVELIKEFKVIMLAQISSGSTVVLTNGIIVKLPLSGKMVTVTFFSNSTKDNLGDYIVFDNGAFVNGVTIKFGQSLVPEYPDFNREISDNVVAKGFKSLMQNIRLQFDFVQGAKTVRKGIHETFGRFLTLGNSLYLVLLHGISGSGKSSIVRSFANDLKQKTAISYISCTKLVRKLRRRTSIEFIQKTFFRLLHSPSSLLILDDFDQLLPNCQNRGGIEEAASEFLSIFSSPLMKRQSLFLLCTSERVDTISSRVTDGRFFDSIFNVDAPDKDQRSQILEGLVPELPDLEIDLLASQTDGFYPYDLSAICYHTKISAKFSGDKGSAQLDSLIKAYQPHHLSNSMLDKPSVSWSDIGGLAHVKSVLKETLMWPTMYRCIFDHCSRSIKLHSGILLYGPPGCGKTLIAKSLAQELGINIVSVKGPELLNKYIGASEQAVRDVFKRASSARPCILFFDEFDSIAPKRGQDESGVTDRVVNQLLTLLDGAEVLDQVFLLAATSHPEMVDSALLRPGRLDKVVYCGMPSKQDRLEILEIHSKRIPHSTRINWETCAEKTHGWTGGDLRAFLTNAYLDAVHSMKHSISSEHEPPFEIVVNEENLQNAFAEMRPSLSESEYSELEQIYSVFRGEAPKTRPREVGMKSKLRI